jgi:predicted regulator of Ras-like GTPase activity (Roadblock/LC7/MglB family)
MDAAQALADLTEISSQVEAAVLFDETGAVSAATILDEHAAAELARAAEALLERARSLGQTGGDVTQIEASTAEGSVFVVRDGARRIAATTAADPTTGLVFYDLKSCLRGSAQPEAKPKRKRAAKGRDEA